VLACAAAAHITPLAAFANACSPQVSVLDSREQHQRGIIYGASLVPAFIDLML
jgi:hypothetical protein